HAVEKVDKGCPVALEEKLERLLVARLHVQHQLDVRPGHSRHILSNPNGLLKLQMEQLCLRRRRGEAGVRQTWNKCCIINTVATPTNTNAAILQFGSRFTSGNKSVAAT